MNLRRLLKSHLWPYRRLLLLVVVFQSVQTFATLTLHPRLSRMEGVEDVPWAKSPPDQKLTVQRPNLLASELALTVNVPDGRTLLLGGLKGTVGKAAEGEKEKPRNVLLLVKPKVVVKQEADAKPAPPATQRR